MAGELTIWSQMDATVKGADTLALAFASVNGGCNKEQGMAIALAAFQENLNPITFMRRYHWIPGKGPSMRSDAMRSEFRMNYGGDYEVQVSTPTECTIKFTDAKGRVRTDTYTTKDMLLSRWPWSKNPGWLKACEEVRARLDRGETVEQCWRAMVPKMKDNWGTEMDWKNMLLARRVSDSLRDICPELVAGIYTPEEMEDVIIGEIVDGPKAPTASEMMAQQKAAAAGTQEATPATPAKPLTASEMLARAAQQAAATAPTTAESATPAVAADSTTPEGQVAAVEEYIEAEFSVSKEGQSEPEPAEQPKVEISATQERLIAKIQQDLPIAFPDTHLAVFQKTLADRKVSMLAQLSEASLQEISDKLAAKIGMSSPPKN